MKPLIIIPTYNEKDNIFNLIEEIKNNLKSQEYSILFVDDNSKDGTIEIIESLIENNNFIHILKRPSKMGLASAYIDGFKYGIEHGFDVFIQMDADFSHNPKYLVKMLDELNNYDVIIGSRNIKGGCVVGWGLLRHIISKGGSLYSKLILNCPINDLTGGFNAWKKDVLEKINLNSIISKGYSFQIEMKYKAFKNKAKIKEIPIVFEDRKFGQSKMSKNIFFEAMMNIWKIRFDRRYNA